LPTAFLLQHLENSTLDLRSRIGNLNGRGLNRLTRLRVVHGVNKNFKRGSVRSSKDTDAPQAVPCEFGSGQISSMVMRTDFAFCAWGNTTISKSFDCRSSALTCLLLTACT